MMDKQLPEEFKEVYAAGLTLGQKMGRATMFAEVRRLVEDSQELAGRERASLLEDFRTLVGADSTLLAVEQATIEKVKSALKGIHHCGSFGDDYCGPAGSCFSSDAADAALALLK